MVSGVMIRASVLASAVVVWATGGVVAYGDDSAVILDAVLGRRLLLKNLTVRYARRDANTPDPQVVAIADSFNREQERAHRPGAKRFRMRVPSGEASGESRFSMADGLVRFDCNRVDEASHSRTVTQEAFLGDRCESFIAEGEQRGRGIIAASLRFPVDAFIDYALGMRLYESQQMMTDEALAESTVVQEADGRFAKMTWVDDQAHRKHEWRLDAQQQFGISRYRVHRITQVGDSMAESDDTLVVDMSCSEFRTIERVSLPHHVEVTIRAPAEASKHGPWLSTTIDVSEYILGDPANTREGLQLIWPDGTDVVDSRLNTHTRLTDGAKALSDEAMRNASRHAAAEPSVIQARHPAGLSLRQIVGINAAFVGAVVLWLLVRRGRRKARGPVKK